MRLGTYPTQRSTPNTQLGQVMQHNPDRGSTEGDDDTLNEVIMAVDLTLRGTVGCSYYVARDEKLFLMEDMQIGDADAIESRIYYLFRGCSYR